MHNLLGKPLNVNDVFFKSFTHHLEQFVQHFTLSVYAQILEIVTIFWRMKMKKKNACGDDEEKNPSRICSYRVLALDRIILTINANERTNAPVCLCMCCALSFYAPIHAGDGSIQTNFILSYFDANSSSLCAHSFIVLPGAFRAETFQTKDIVYFT